MHLGDKSVCVQCQGDEALTRHLRELERVHAKRLLFEQMKSAAVLQEPREHLKTAFESLYHHDSDQEVGCLWSACSRGISSAIVTDKHMHACKHRLLPLRGSAKNCFRDGSRTPTPDARKSSSCNYCRRRGPLTQPAHLHPSKNEFAR